MEQRMVSRQTLELMYMHDAVYLTDLRTESARILKDRLTDGGYTVYSGADDLKRHDVYALQSIAETLPLLLGVIHPAPPRIFAGCENATEDMWLRARDEGALSSWAVTRVFGEKLRRDGGGSLIFLGSVHAEKPLGEGFLFSMGCASTQMLMREACIEYAPSGVRTFYVERGPVEGEDCRENRTSIYYGTDMRNPAHKAPAAGDLAGLIGFLLTDSSAPLNGADLRADGGTTMFYGHRNRLEGVEYVERKRR